jgi:hypothetical protein
MAQNKVTDEDIVNFGWVDEYLSEVVARIKKLVTMRNEESGCKSRKS